MHNIPTPEAEEQAYAFAADFFVPEDELKGAFYPLNLDVLARLKLRWGVFMAALLRRAKEMGESRHATIRFLISD